MAVLGLVLAGALWTHDADSGGAAVPGTAVDAAAPGTAGAPAARAQGGTGRAEAGAGQQERPARGTGLHIPPSTPAGARSPAPAAGGNKARSPQPSTTGSGVRPGRPPAPTASGVRPGRRPAPTASGVRPGRPPATALRPLPPSRATRILIPYLDVDAPVTDLRLDRNRRLEAPPGDDPNLAGWYKDGPAPGAQGTAVAVGHLDTDTGGAVFAGLSELKPGRLIEVRRADGRSAVYTVDAVREFEKAHFPDREVYGSRGRPELRLITCGGNYDRRTGYSGNLVVFAHLSATRVAPAAPRH
ncbi:class F sortase [Streptomyces sp. NBC_00028]|uniref:class F sortase n=1 Tax=Streptomyces sp. NBC_00028 TaxID=2975624 RepID=UPI003245194C